MSCISQLYCLLYATVLIPSLYYQSYVHRRGLTVKSMLMPELNANPDADEDNAAIYSTQHSVDDRGASCTKLILSHGQSH